ncbi:hypothetical protein DKZ29_06315 [Limosilactobacillus reuteri]|uniref:hypothetical protein n=1 Tax=Limosilactobacillus reuteri TaxID=1598 RepID=UPI000D6EC23E|nr:hypothetical protein [Limosilactobacillus reuteri]PWT33283.1 hypothetical protein DKZ24_11525 [Limosilactobacillus reuteri]PWT56839.1 hypothetical protein DKZ30_11500 [Limosilactobacillus reuteri]PWT58298.1 hypothetical protein DKZ29_06315 [Limosilactobacillus reuteri]PWT62834.1 hypothetical protein DKZ28_11525 [Limosilactobacillus reuteri]
MNKIVRLIKIVKDNKGNDIATIQVELTGDGSTPDPLTAIYGYGQIIGFNDDGSPIYDMEFKQRIKDEEQKFMAEAIKEQKKLCIENGVDPDLVNILNAEKKENNE